jgi:superfamily II DNA or RNA helicase
VVLFINLLARSDIQDLETLIGKSLLDSLKVLEPSVYKPSSLKKLVLELYSPFELLFQKEKRNLLIDLLRPNEVEMLCDVLGVDKSRAYENLKQQKFRRNSTKLNAFLTFFDVNYTSEEELEFLELEPKPQYPLFSHQRNAVKETIEYLNSSSNRCVLHMPTGAGKTRTAMNISCDFLRSKEPGLIIWLANTEELCQQAYEEFSRAWSFLGDRDINIYKFWGDHDISETGVPEDGIIIAGLQKLYSRVKTDLDNISRFNRNLDMIIVDEAHICVAETYKLIINAMTLSKSKIPSILGLTATPGRTWNDPEIDRELSKFFYSQKVILKIDGYSNPVDYLQDQGYLAKATYQRISIHDVLDEADKQRINSSLEIPLSVLNKLASDQVRNLQIVEELEKLITRHKRIMFFATTVEHSELIASLMSYKGIWAKSVTGKTDSTLRKKYIDNYKDEDNEPKILCNYGVLTTGFDAPKTSCALIARPSKSLVLYSQMVGRAIRGIKAGGNAEAEIVTVVDIGLPGFKSIADSFLNWEDVWE